MSAKKAGKTGRTAPLTPAVACSLSSGYCENCPNPAECYLSGRCWPVGDYVPDAGKLCAEMDEEFALASESQREAAGPDGLRRTIKAMGGALEIEPTGRLIAVPCAALFEGRITRKLR